MAKLNKKKKEVKIEKEQVVVYNNISEKKNFMSFEVYFARLKTENKNVRNHHKEPMRKFFEERCGLEATKEQFDEVFSKY